MRLNVVSRRLFKKNLFVFDIDEVSWIRSGLQTKALVVAYGMNLVEEL